MIKLEDIVEATSEVYGIVPAEITGKRRTAMRAEARQVAFWVARTITPFSLEEIAEHFDRDHTTVLHGVHRIGDRLDGDDHALRSRIAEATRIARGEPRAFRAKEHAA